MKISVNTIQAPPIDSPAAWKKSCTGTENSLHQLSPYIGKLKSAIAKDLILEYSRSGDMVIDPFSGSGTVPLEASLLGRRVFACDISPYASILTRAKLNPPDSFEQAIQKAEILLSKADKLPSPDLRKVPKWIRDFFHAQTLKDAINFAQVCRRKGNEFYFACFLGILHHQRPGFLSFPSSHLVPYLRNKKFPKSEFPEMYSYRELRPRLLAKIGRVYSRIDQTKKSGQSIVKQGTIQNIRFPKEFDCLITSPPYMNTLSYIRDNRLRLWFVDPVCSYFQKAEPTSNKETFKKCIVSMAQKIENSLKIKGYCILVVGERIASHKQAPLSQLVADLIKLKSPSLKLQKTIKDEIPNIRRSRRDCRGTKSENILIFQKMK